LTYIIGSKCTDGIVLVGDTKITIGGGTEYSYAKKIIHPSENIVVGSSGSSGLYRSFQSRLILGIEKISEERGDQNINWEQELVLLAERVIHEMGISYGKETIAWNLDALLVIRTGFEPELIHLSGRGYPEPITDYAAVGHGEPYGAVLLKTLWNKLKPMRMEEFAKIGCLAIKYVQDLELDNSVGVDTRNNGIPQVWYIPSIPERELESKKTPIQAKRIFNKYAIRELSVNEIGSLMRYASKNVAKIKKSMETLSF
jgi:20S proteasome alpha/beta subunit